MIAELSLQIKPQTTSGGMPVNWLLVGRHGAAIRQLGCVEGQAQRIARAVAVLRAADQGCGRREGGGKGVRLMYG